MLDILSILDLVVWSNWYYLYYCSNHYLIHHFKREQKRTAFKLEYIYKFFWLKFKQQEWATIYCWSLSCWMRETLVVKYIDLDKEILPKKPGEKKEMQTKIWTSNGQFIVVWWPTTYSSHFSCFHLYIENCA